MSPNFLKMKNAIENVLFVYINMYVALLRWVAENEADKELEITFKDDNVELFPPLRAKEVIAAEDYLHGAALIHTVMQLGRILDTYLRDSIRPLIRGQLVDDTWYSLEVVEEVSHIRLSDVFNYGYVVRLNAMRKVVNEAGSLAVTQPQILDLTKKIIGFAEDFDARLTLESQIKPKGKKHETDHLITGGSTRNVESKSNSKPDGFSDSGDPDKFDSEGRYLDPGPSDLDRIDDEDRPDGIDEGDITA